MRLAVVGIGTDVGKTVVSAIAARLLEADYWKPISSGGDDRSRVAKWSGQRCHKEAVRLEAPVASHEAARREGRRLDIEAVQLPEGVERLVVEGAGGVLSPFCDETSMLDLFLRWEMEWLVVSRTYLGSINHTMLTIEALRARGVEPSGIVFVGESDRYVLNRTGIPCVGVMEWKPVITKETIEEQCEEWRNLTFWSNRLSSLRETRPTAGIPIPSI